MDDALSDRDVFWRLRLSQPQITWVWADRGYVDELMDWDRERLQSFDLVVHRVVARARAR